MAERPVWKITFYGTRGSVPVTDQGYQEFGGNTTCVLIDLQVGNSKEVIGVFDAGTGIRNLGKDIMEGKIEKPKLIFIAFTHFHWDHIDGFPFFIPFYRPGEFEVQIYAPTEFDDKRTLKEVFELPLQKDYFPVQLENMGVDFQFLTNTEFDKGNRLDILQEFKTNLHSHPGGAYGYRITAFNRTVVFCTDVEHGDGVDMGVVEFAKGADLLIHDAQYTTEELESHKGWGHSSYEQAIEVAKLAGVKQLVMTHHDPDHNDEFLRYYEGKCQEVFPNCCLAKEGMEILV